VQLAQQMDGEQEDERRRGCSLVRERQPCVHPEFAERGQRLVRGGKQGRGQRESEMSARKVVL
jgi:hypothetical protein